VKKKIDKKKAGKQYNNILLASLIVENIKVQYKST